jgi:hypothetical protein
MTKKISIAFIVAFSAFFLFSACSSTKVEDKEKEKPKKVITPPTEGLEKCKSYSDAGKLMIESVIKGLSTDNYDLYSRDFTEQNKKYFNKKVFTQAAEAVKKELGDFESKIYIGFWIKGKYTIILWKARFTKTKDDILLEMYVDKTDEGSYQIAALKVI